MTAKTENGGGLRSIPWRIIGWGMAAFLLLLPLITNAPWTLSDYIFMGLLFGSVGLGLELAAWKGNAAYLMASGVALAAGFLLVWITGAVGIIGSEREDANILFLGVLAVALLGAIAAMFRPAGMAAAMVGAALAQILVPFAAWFFWPGTADSLLRPEVPVLTLFFAGMWLVSASLFRRAAR